MADLNVCLQIYHVIWYLTAVAAAAVVVVVVVVVGSTV